MSFRILAEMAQTAARYERALHTSLENDQLIAIQENRSVFFAWDPWGPWPWFSWPWF